MGRCAWFCVAVVVLGACKDSAQKKPSRQSITVSVDGKEVGGLRVTLDGKTETLSKGGYKPWAIFTYEKLPATDPTHVKLEIPTACGVTHLDLPVTPRDRFANSLKLDARRPKLPAEPTSLWIAAPPGTEVGVGTVKVKADTPDKGPHMIFDLACAPQHDVTVAGAKVGSVDSADTGDRRAKGIFVTATPADCYQIAYKAYGNATGGGAPPSVLRGASVYRVSNTISYFLTPAPSQIKVNPGTQDAYASELTKIACP